MPSKYGFQSLSQLEEAAGFIILGSASHVDQKLSWHKELLDFIIPKIESKIPTLGICFGHQLIANYYGCKVDYIQNDKNKITEVRKIKFANDALGFSKDDFAFLSYAHAQIVTTMSSQFELIASSDAYKFEALKHKDYPYWSFQAHPEASEDFIVNEAKLKNKTLISQTLTDSYNLLMGFTKEL